MSRILLLNPSRWGRGITPIWVASHTASLRKSGHTVELFDSTFYSDWTQNENDFNTANGQYKPSEYNELIQFSSVPVIHDLQQKIDSFNPDIIFFSALSSHIHGEGEYSAIQFAYDLLSEVTIDALLVAGGLQPTASPESSSKRFPDIDYFITGESELVLAQLADYIESGRDLSTIPGLYDPESPGKHAKQPIIHDFEAVGDYDYSLFDGQVLLRPYNGTVVKAVDYELSRGCPFTCSYCVETVIQRYYGHEEATSRGMLKTANSYLRSKSSDQVIREISTLSAKYGVQLFRCQDTNFLTISQKTLQGLANYLSSSPRDIMLYIETRPEGINPTTCQLLKDLHVDGVGMGLELSTQSFRESSLHRFCDQSSIEKAFRLLREWGIKRTAYNIIGLPGQDEDSILQTIAFNQKIDPDNITVAFFSPYLGTQQQSDTAGSEYFLDYEFDLDSQLRSMSKSTKLSAELLSFYKANFNRLVSNPDLDIADLKREYNL